MYYTTVLLSEIREKDDPASKGCGGGQETREWSVCVFPSPAAATPHNMILFKIKYYIPWRRSAAVPSRCITCT